jgi:hypothetical protein
LLLLVELFCFSLQYLGKEQFTFLGDLTAKNSSDFEAFDSNLGWREIDARASSEQDVDVVVLGGSFTYWDEVSKENTWGHRLQDISSRVVDNQGVRSYGIDQAVMNLEALLHEGCPAKHVVLTVIRDSINRNQLVYWPFYAKASTLRYTKPRFALHQSSESLILLPNPISEKKSLAKLYDQEFLKKIGRNEYWYKKNMPPKNQLPFSSMLFDLGFWQQVNKIFVNSDLIHDSLWTHPDQLRLHNKIIDRFVELSNSNRA